MEGNALDGIYRDDVQGWIISYDQTWKESRFEGVTEFYPPGLPSPEQAGRSFRVAVQIVSGRPASRLNPPANASTDFEDRNGDISVTPVSGGGEKRTYAYDWTDLCIAADECPAGPITLQVVVEGATATLWNKYHYVADAMIQSLWIAKDSTGVGGSPVHTRYGVYDQGFAQGYDDRTVTLVRFLDARVEQADAESFMTSQAKNDFAHSTVCSSLYVNKMTHDMWLGYEVMFRSNQNGRTAFTVILSAGPGSAGCGETIVVGAGSASSPMIISDTYQSLGEN